jgi:hypothetical protein
MGLVNINLFQQCGRVEEGQYPDVCGISACAEQGLALGEDSCLAELMLPHFQSPDELWEATRLVYTVCKHTFSLGTPHHFSSTRETADQHLRMGLSVTGCMQALEEHSLGCPITTNVSKPTMLPTHSFKAYCHLSKLLWSNHWGLSVS